MFVRCLVSEEGLEPPAGISTECLSLSPVYFSIAFFGSQLTFGRELKLCNTATPSEQVFLAVDICNMHVHTQSLRSLIKDLLFIPQIHLPLLESPTGLVEKLFEESFETFFPIPDRIYSQLLFLSKQERSCVHSWVLFLK